MSDDYLMVGGNPARTCHVPDGPSFDGDFETRWKTSVAADGHPLVLDGVVYVPVERSEAGVDELDHRVVGYDIEDGSGVCRFDFPDGGYCHELVSDGRHLVAVTDDGVSAFDPKAERLQWSHGFPDDQHESGFRSVTVADGTAYADDWASSMLRDGVVDVTIRRLDAASGEDTAVHVDEAPASYSGTMARIGYRDGTVVLEENGSVVGSDQRGDGVWREPIPELEEADFYKVPADALAVGKRHVYVAPSMARVSEVGNSERLETYVTAFDVTTGTRQWRVPAGQAGVESIAVAGETVLVGPSGGGLRALDTADGSLEWENYDYGRRVTVIGETVYTTRSENGRPYLLGVSLEDGTESWRHELDAGLGSRSYPIVVDDAVVLPGDPLVCLEPAAPGDDGGTSGAVAKGQTPAECPSCGGSVDRSDAFCADCGAELDDEACPRCGEGLDGDEAFCPSCGRELDDERTCDACGAALDGDEAFCPSCGADQS